MLSFAFPYPHSLFADSASPVHSEAELDSEAELEVEAVKALTTAGKWASVILSARLAFVVL